MVTDLDEIQTKQRYLKMSRSVRLSPSKWYNTARSRFLKALKDSLRQKPEESTTDFQCETCNSYFNSRKELEEHCRSIYKAYFCDHCNEVFNDSHDCSPEYARCAFCKEASQNIFSKPEDHVCFHAYKEDDLENFKDKGLVECIYCSKKIPEGEMERHQTTHGKRAIGNVRHCENCSAVFPNLAEYNQHCKKQHPEEPGTCKVCNIYFPNFKELMAHRQEKHMARQQKKHTPKIERRISDKELTEPRNLDELAYKCPQCDEAFTSIRLLVTHRLQHDEAEEMKKKNTCFDCNIKFDSNSDYKKHRNEVHIRRPMVCVFCGKLEKNMTAHISRSHSAPENLQCDTCGKVFTSKKYLSRHHLVHTNDFKHKCSVCGKGFKTRFSMKVHQRSHDEVKPFECMVCLKTFTTKQWRDKHMKSH